MPNRPAAGAIWPSLDLLEYVTGEPLPEVVHADLLFRELRTAAADVVCWTDDVFTLEKERARGDFHNFVVVLEEATSAMASRLNSSEYRFVYLLPTWHCFLWAHMSQSPGVHDQGEASTCP